MTVWDLLVASARRWYVVLAGLALTAGVLLLVHQTPGVYATQTNVLFLAPVTPNSPNTISSPTSGVISTAGLVERIVNKGVEKSPTSGSVALAGQGVDNGYSVELPNAGGQWASNFNRPVLQVQVTGPSAERVRTELRRLVEQIRAVAREIQVEAGVGQGMLITTQVSPEAPGIGYHQGHRPMALAVTALLGLVLTGLAVWAVDRFPGWRAVRRPRRV